MQHVALANLVVQPAMRGSWFSACAASSAQAAAAPPARGRAPAGHTGRARRRTGRRDGQDDAEGAPTLVRIVQVGDHRCRGRDDQRQAQAVQRRHRRRLRAGAAARGRARPRLAGTGSSAGADGAALPPPERGALAARDERACQGQGWSAAQGVGAAGSGRPAERGGGEAAFEGAARAAWQARLRVGARQAKARREAAPQQRARGDEVLSVEAVAQQARKRRAPGLRGERQGRHSSPRSRTTATPPNSPWARTSCRPAAGSRTAAARHAGTAAASAQQHSVRGLARGRATLRHAGLSHALRARRARLHQAAIHDERAQRQQRRVQRPADAQEHAAEQRQVRALSRVRDGERGRGAEPRPRPQPVRVHGCHPLPPAACAAPARDGRGAPSAPQQRSLRRRHSPAGSRAGSRQKVVRPVRCRTCKARSTGPALCARF